MTEVGVIAQIRAATNNPIALLVGCLLGGFVPLASYFVAHQEVKTFWSVPTLLVVGGLVYSAKTVFQWGKQAFNCGWKATGFILLLEGIMILSSIPWLGHLSLVYLVSINAVATGCLLAQRDTKKLPKVKLPKSANNNRTKVKAKKLQAVA